MFDCYDTLITPEEVADMLGCGMNTTYKLLKSGKIKAMRIGRSWKQLGGNMKKPTWMMFHVGFLLPESSA